jgi:hypothetical protein
MIKKISRHPPFVNSFSRLGPLLPGVPPGLTLPFPWGEARTAVTREAIVRNLISGRIKNKTKSWDEENLGLK